MQGRIGSGPGAGERITTVGSEEEYESKKGGRRCANLSGFSLNANVCIPAKARHQLEKLCRYVARPSIAMERLSKLPDGRVLYQLRHRWRNGATHMIFDPLDLIGKLAALVPPPRFNLIRYQGVLAPASRWRGLVVPLAPSDGESGDSAHKGECSQCKAELSARPRAAAHPRNYSWAELMKRVFGFDVLKCDTMRRPDADSLRDQSPRGYKKNSGLPRHSVETAANFPRHTGQSLRISASKLILHQPFIG